MALIEIRDLEKIYSDGEVETPALRGVSLDIMKGEFVAIMGPSGSGKSTLLHILGFLDNPTSGTYRFDGKASTEFSETELAHIRNEKMGFVFQSFNLLSRTSVYDNVRLPLFYSQRKPKEWDVLTREAIDSVGLSHRAQYYTSQLSGGEKQRVAIARALVNKPEIIFADEPTGNLDTASGKVIMDILQTFNLDRGYTILLITHETYTAQHAKRIIHLKDGQLERDEKVEHWVKAKDNFHK